MLFSLHEGAWVSHTLVRYEDFLPIQAYGEHGNGGNNDIFHVVDYYPDDEEDEDEQLGVIVKPRVIGFSEQLDCIFLQAEPGVFMISLESGQHQRVLEPDQRFSGHVYPYSTFYTAGTKLIAICKVSHISPYISIN